MTRHDAYDTDMARRTLALPFSGHLLTEWRERRGLRVGDLADRSGVDPSLVSRYESGNRKPTPANLVKLAKALEIEVDRLLDAGAA